MCRQRLLEGFALLSPLPILQTFDNGQTDDRSAPILSHPTWSMTEVASCVYVGVPFMCEGSEAGLHSSLGAQGREREVSRERDIALETLGVLTLCADALPDTMLPLCCFRSVVSSWLLS